MVFIPLLHIGSLILARTHTHTHSQRGAFLFSRYYRMSLFIPYVSGISLSVGFRVCMCARALGDGASVFGLRGKHAKTTGHGCIPDQKLAFKEIWTHI